MIWEQVADRGDGTPFHSATLPQQRQETLHSLLYTHSHAKIHSRNPVVYKNNQCKQGFSYIHLGNLTFTLQQQQPLKYTTTHWLTGSFSWLWWILGNLDTLMLKLCLLKCTQFTYDSFPRLTHPCSPCRRHSTNVQRYNCRLCSGTPCLNICACLACRKRKESRHIKRH